MPLYLITLAHPHLLTPSQRRSLAESLTRIHTTLFSTPSLFVNVRFTNAAGGPSAAIGKLETAPADDATSFAGGKESRTNIIAAHVRHGPSRPREKYDELCRLVKDAWDQVVVDPQGKTEAEENRLHTIFVLGDIVAGWERGFSIPGAGEDAEWLRGNMGEFERRAEGGDKVMGELVQEIKARREEFGLE